jgi:hypothetical protein
MLPKTVCIALAVLLTSSLGTAQRLRYPREPWPQKSLHTTTEWAVTPSLKYDALCALNVLSGDPYYLEFYREDYNRLVPRLTAAEKNEFVTIKKIIKDQNKGIISANLALILSVEPGDSLDDVLAALGKPGEIRERLQATPYYTPSNFAEFLRVRPHVIAAIRALQRIGFEADWARNIRPRIAARATQLQAQLTRYNIVPLQEQALGHRLAGNRIMVYLLYYSQPHGIKITGTRYLTHFEYPFEIVLHNAVHEMLHPPYSLEDPATRRAVETLRSDEFLMDKVKRHNPSFGYNEFEGFVEEDCVQALEQSITQSLGLQDDEQAYWRQQDDSMHVLAIALYELMLRGRMQPHESFPHFLQRMVFNGELSNPRLVQLNREFWAEPNGARFPRS